MDKIVIQNKDSAHIKVMCDAGIAMELQEYFTFSVPGHKFHPKFKNKMWDGKIRLFQAFTRTVYAGLRHYVEQFARERGYAVEYENNWYSEKEFSLVEASAFAKAIKTTLEPRDYQLQAFAHCVRTSRALMLSPTASGKSFIIYLLSRFFQSKQVLIIVPTTQLVHQLASDFVEYGGRPDHIQKIYESQQKDVTCPFVITTWQSIYKMPKEWLAQFGCVIGDEAHGFKAKSLTGIMDKMPSCKYRFGFTGTLDGTQTHKLVLEGLFGPVKKVTTTSELIENQTLASFKIKAILLQHSQEKCELLKKATYQEELTYLVLDPARNRFICNLALSLKGNTLILFRYVDKHGIPLFNLISPHREEVSLVHGDIDGEEREAIRKSIEVSQNSITIASLGTFSTGVNIKNLHNIIFASPSKSRIKVLQSIGRGLRKGETKDGAILYDIGDDLSWKSRQNSTLTHFSERIQLYNQEKFPYKIYTISLKD